MYTKKKFGASKPWERGSGGRSSARSSVMFQATCGECGKDCEVPFKPVNGRPVFCQNCFKRDGGDERPYGRQERPSYGERPSRPSYGDRPQRPSFADRAERPAADPSKDQFKAVNAKLDLILKALRELVGDQD